MTLQPAPCCQLTRSTGHFQNFLSFTHLDLKLPKFLFNKEDGQKTQMATWQRKNIDEWPETSTQRCFHHFGNSKQKKKENKLHLYTAKAYKMIP